LFLLAAAPYKPVLSYGPTFRFASKGGSEQPGWEFVRRIVDAQSSRRLIENRPEGALVTDLLLTALSLTIDRWNRENDERAENQPADAGESPAVYVVL